MLPEEPAEESWRRAEWTRERRAPSPTLQAGPSGPHPWRTPVSFRGHQQSFAGHGCECAAPAATGWWKLFHESPTNTPSLHQASVRQSCGWIVQTAVSAAHTCDARTLVGSPAHSPPFRRAHVRLAAAAHSARQPTHTRRGSVSRHTGSRPGHRFCREATRSRADSSGDPAPEGTGVGSGGGSGALGAIPCRRGSMLGKSLFHNEMRSSTRGAPASGCLPGRRGAR
jgi:hypothetical protein